MVFVRAQASGFGAAAVEAVMVAAAAVEVAAVVEAVVVAAVAEAAGAVGIDLVGMGGHWLAWTGRHWVVFEDSTSDSSMNDLAAEQVAVASAAAVDAELVAVADSVAVAAADVEACRTDSWEIPAWRRRPP